MEEAKKKNQIEKALEFLDKNVDKKYSELIDFKSFLNLVHNDPQRNLRNVFQLFRDMFEYYVGEGKDEYSGDTQSIKYLHYDFSKIFEDDSDKPFFAGRIFKNRLMKVIDALTLGSHQNKIYIFRGPPGSGKSIFLYNLLRKFEEYTSTPEGLNYKTVWRLNLKRSDDRVYNKISEDILRTIPEYKNSVESVSDRRYVDISCPCNDHPLLVIPKEHRRAFIDDLLKNEEFKYKLFTEKEYTWLFEKEACTICTSLYNSLLYLFHNADDVFNMVYAKPIKYNRRLGDGISVYNPGDMLSKKNVFSDEIIQKKINHFLQQSNQVKYVFSKFAKTNNGIYCLMDVKSNNKERLIELHNIISERIHKIEEIEESVDSLFIAIINPEDQDKFENIKSFSDRIEYIDVPYILDYKTEVKIYENQFGKYISNYFQPQILDNFAKVIISTRLNEKSTSLDQWIEHPEKYERYCDENLLLLKMDIYAGVIPEWLTNEDRKSFTSKVRKEIIHDSVNEGKRGFSGRESIKIFNEFFSKYKDSDKLIDIEMFMDYFIKNKHEFTAKVNTEFLKSLKKLYDYDVAQQVKEALFDFNKMQISRNIKNYLFAINYELNTNITCPYTNDNLEITEEFFSSMEEYLLKDNKNEQDKSIFRKDIQYKFTSHTLTQEMLINKTQIEETKLYHELYQNYIFNLKRNVLKPLLENENVRLALKNFHTDTFNTFDQKIQKDIKFLIDNLQQKYAYSEKGALEICLYIIDNYHQD